MKFKYIGEKIDLKEYVLIMPSISEYLLDRHLIDVFLKNLPNIKRIGYILSANIAPVYQEIDEEPPFDGKISSCELFIDEINKFAFFQMRSFFDAPNNFIALELSKFLQTFNFRYIFIISSCSNLFFDDDNRLHGAILCKKDSQGIELNISSISDCFLFRKVNLPCTEFEGYFPKMYRSGLTYHLMKHLPDSTICLVVFIESFLELDSRHKISESIVKIFKIPDLSIKIENINLVTIDNI